MMAYEVSVLKDKEMKQKQKSIEEELRQGYNETKSGRFAWVFTG